jgi:MoaA/NifB/PqqE/SkfB family radical SAM enzyme
MENAENKGKKRELSFENLKIILDFLERSDEKIARLMGGEPTLHSKFRQFINCILSRGFRVHIFTNGLFPAETAKFLANKGKSIKYSFNIDPPEVYSGRNWNLILNNLKILAPLGHCLIGNVIWKMNFNINYLLDLADKHSIKTIMLRVANPVIGEKNKYILPERYPIFTKNIIREIEKTRKREIKIGFGCGFFEKMFTSAQQRFLKNNVVDLKWGCDANSGRFDIAADLSVFRCFPLSNWRKKNLFNFKNSKEAENYFAGVMRRHQSRHNGKNYIRQGPCFAYLLRR